MHLPVDAFPGLKVIGPSVFGDERGFFQETWHLDRLKSLINPPPFVQDNVSCSRQGVLRGLHCQNPHPQAKLITVFYGSIYDVAVDLRKSSPTFLHWTSINLTSRNHLQFYLPAGFAHGFLVLSEQAIFHYKCSDYYSPSTELCIQWNDPTIGIVWPIGEPVLSKRDAAAPLLKNIPSDRLYE